MSLYENILLALEGLRTNKMRAALTMLGIIIGIASVIAIMTVGDSLGGSITDSMSSLGATNVTLSIRERDQENTGMMGPGGMGMGGSGTDYDEDDLISPRMLEDLEKRYGEWINGISLTENVGSAQAKKKKDYANLTITGVSAGYLDLNNVTLLAGRDLSEKDGTRRIAIVSDKLVNNLFDGKMQSALGQTIKVYWEDEVITFDVVGVYEYEASAMGISTSSEQNIRTNLYIPIDAAKKIANADDGFASATVMVNPEMDSEAFAEKAEEFLNQYYEKNKDYEISATSMSSMLDSMDSMVSTISIALSVIAGISLLVGGIGVMNIMLVSVTERTREIGTRKALGATNNNIRMQFVVESMIVCLMGGIIGILLGGSVGYLGSSLLGTGAWPSISSIAISVGFALAIGIFFGYYPANKAAQLDPIEALRYE